MKDILQELMNEATRLTQAGRLNEATAAIQRALKNAPVGMPSAGGSGAFGSRASADPTILDLDSESVREVLVEEVVAKERPAEEIDAESIREAEGRPRESAPVGGADQFISGVCTAASRTGRYKLYIPPNHAGRSLPLVVLLHGCTQDPDDFAAGTGMNARAREQGFFVLYPAQAQEANASRCWNWFKHNHQRRGAGEPALIAEMTRAVVRQYGIDQKRVFVAGLSAGGAMAAVVAGEYPDLFSAVGIHSGLPAGAATNLPQALAAMKAPQGAAVKSKARVPTIVFHGDADHTVHPGNGEQAVAAVVRDQRSPQIEKGTTRSGKRYTRSIHSDVDAGGGSRVIAEHWVVHGAGHAWSGGQAAGSYTDASGPDATGEMLRFFLEHPGSGSSRGSPHG